MPHSSSRHLLALALLLALLTLSYPPPAAAQPSGVRCFQETGHCIAGQLATFWASNGGLSVFGLPISPLLDLEANGRTLHVQWFERARLELHPDQPPPYAVQLGQLGLETLQGAGWVWQNFPQDADAADCQRFAETGHLVCAPILSMWQNHGLQLDGRPGYTAAESLALFGLPISGLQSETLENGQTYQVQWFERARFEIHPGETEPRVLLGRLGASLFNADTARAVAQRVATPCPFRAPAGVRVECGALLLPLDYGHPAGRSVAVSFAIFRDPRPAPDPILYLAGGPGSPAIEQAVTLWQAWRSFIAGRDFIVVDQRGVGTSWPALRCPEVAAFNRQVREHGLQGQTYAHGEAAAILVCAERLTASGFPMRAFTTAAAVNDLDQLRQSLGYAQWNVLGISYGTRWALALLRDYPASVRSLVLDSPYPLQASLYATMPAHLERSLQQLFGDCAAHAHCASAYPELEARFWRLVAALNANPAAANLGPDPNHFTGNQLLELIFRQLYRTRSLPHLPAAIVAAERGDFGPFRALAAGGSAASTGSSGQSQALYYAIQCPEDLQTLPPGWREATLAAHARVAGFYTGLLELSGEAEPLCARFGAATPDARWQVPANSNAPALILAGSYDPITPPQWRELAAVGLSQAYTYEFPGTGHAVLGRGACPVGMIRSFLNNPAQAPDSGCVAQLGGPAFR